MQRRRNTRISQHGRRKKRKHNKREKFNFEFKFKFDFKYISNMLIIKG